MDRAIADSKTAALYLRYAPAKYCYAKLNIYYFTGIGGARQR